MTNKWNNVPWRQPDDDSVREVLAKYGLSGHTIDPIAIDDLTTEDNRFLSAAGTFGNPVNPVKGADYSEFSGVIGESNDKGGVTYHAYQDGKEIATKDAGGDFDTVAFWNEHSK